MTTDEMERMPHKRPDDALAKIVAEFAPRIDAFLTNTDVLGEDVFADPQIKEDFRNYRVAHDEALGECFDTYFAPSELPEGATERDKFNARESFVKEAAQLMKMKRLKILPSANALVESKRILMPIRGSLKHILAGYVMGTCGKKRKPRMLQIVGLLQLNHANLGA
jgi:hypothetical protein